MPVARSTDEEDTEHVEDEQGSGDLRLSTGFRDAANALFTEIGMSSSDEDGAEGDDVHEVPREAPPPTPTPIRASAPSFTSVTFAQRVWAAEEANITLVSPLLDARTPAFMSTPPSTPPNTSPFTIAPTGPSARGTVSRADAFRERHLHVSNFAASFRGRHALNFPGPSTCIPFWPHQPTFTTPDQELATHNRAVRLHNACAILCGPSFFDMPNRAICDAFATLSALGMPVTPTVVTYPAEQLLTLPPSLIRNMAKSFSAFRALMTDTTMDTHPDLLQWRGTFSWEHFNTLGAATSDSTQSNMIWNTGAAAIKTIPLCDWQSDLSQIFNGWGPTVFATATSSPSSSDATEPPVKKNNTYG